MSFRDRDRFPSSGFGARRPPPPRYRDEAPAERGPEEVIASFRRGEDEALQLRVCSYNGRSYLDLRVHYQDASGEWRQTKKGTSIRVGEVHGLVEALEKFAASEGDR